MRFGHGTQPPGNAAGCRLVLPPVQPGSHRPRAGWLAHGFASVRWVSRAVSAQPPVCSCGHREEECVRVWLRCSGCSRCTGFGTTCLCLSAVQAARVAQLPGGSKGLVLLQPRALHPSSGTSGPGEGRANDGGFVSARSRTQPAALMFLLHLICRRIKAPCSSPDSTKTWHRTWGSFIFADPTSAPSRVPPKPPLSPPSPQICAWPALLASLRPALPPCSPPRPVTCHGRMTFTRLLLV